MLIDLAFLRSIRSATARVLVINGHPDPSPERFCSALCAAYAAGARESGQKIRNIAIGCDDDDAVRETALGGLVWSDRVFIAYPLWLDGPPPALRSLFETLASDCGATLDEHVSKCRIVVTAGLPGVLYRTGSAGCAARRGALGIPVLETAPTTIIGAVDKLPEQERSRWLSQMHLEGTRVSRK